MLKPCISFAWLHAFCTDPFSECRLTNGEDDLDQPCQGRCSTEIMGLKFKHSELPPVAGDSTKFEIWFCTPANRFLRFTTSGTEACRFQATQFLAIEVPVSGHILIGKLKTLPFWANEETMLAPIHRVMWGSQVWDRILQDFISRSFPLQGHKR